MNFPSLLSRSRFSAIIISLAFSVFLPALHAQSASVDIPLPEHPRPDFRRSLWQNLNGVWEFRFDPDNLGLQENWFAEGNDFPEEIRVPFPWGAPLSGVEDRADIGWYRRSIDIPEGWDGHRIFLIVGAADWRTTAWLDGQKLGEHEGGYTPFEFELPEDLEPGSTHQLVIRVDDAPRDFKLEGKQGYGNARGIWQTPYLEARAPAFIEKIQLTPKVGEELVTVEASTSEAAGDAVRTLQLTIRDDDGNEVAQSTLPGQPGAMAAVNVAIPNPHLWSLEDPHLYWVEAVLGEGPAADTVHTYFGMREVSVMDLPGSDHRYVALNGKPIYLQLALDQAYHPEGYYTFPSDAFMRDEILRSRQIGLNGMRIHVKIGIPRKLYWADRLGMLIMADVPNSWGEPGPEMQQEAEYAMRQMIARDFNHPAIFSWIIFNETWGLFTTTDEANNERSYLPATQEWVASMVQTAKELDPSRLVEDNSVCCGIGHTETDLNTWHSYLPGWAWKEHLDDIASNTEPGNTWNFEEGYEQGEQPNINSEFGNVWGYEGSTGDVDWSWDYHRAVNEFRRHPAIAGWLYTEHHDVVNEWNGYWRYDRSEKETGMDALAEGMSLRDLHAPMYISTGQDISREVEAGDIVSVPLYASFLTGRQDIGDTLRLRAELYGWDALGQEEQYFSTYKNINYRPWMTEELSPLEVPMPGKTAVAVLKLTLEDAAGDVLQRNFTTFVVKGPATAELNIGGGKVARLITFSADSFDEAAWSQKQWNVREGRKVNGAGSGFFEYRISWPDDIDPEEVQTATLVLEASAKRLFGKDRDDSQEMDGDYMRGRGTHDPSRNPNAYPMTDETDFPSALTVKANGHHAGRYELPDDPADHRGILSWHYQLQDRKLREAGSYGYRISAPLPPAALREAAETGTLVLRLEVPQGLPHGLAIYGAEFGRYPIDPTVVVVRK